MVLSIMNRFLSGVASKASFKRASASPKSLKFCINTGIAIISSQTILVYLQRYFALKHDLLIAHPILHNQFSIKYPHFQLIRELLTNHVALHWDKKLLYQCQIVLYDLLLRVNHKDRLYRQKEVWLSL